MSSKQQQEQDAADAKAAQQKAERARAAVKAKAEQEKDRQAEEAERSVEVRAVRKGFYPAEGRLRVPGAPDGSDYFTYVRVIDERTGKLEPVLPSWMEDVSGSGLKSREEGVVPEYRKQPALATERAK